MPPRPPSQQTDGQNSMSQSMPAPGKIGEGGRGRGKAGSRPMARIVPTLISQCQHQVR